MRQTDALMGRETMSRWQIYEVTTDADGVDCYIKRGYIVRCKECKHWVQTYEYIRRCAEMGGTPTKADDFCSYGERKESE